MSVRRSIGMFIICMLGLCLVLPSSLLAQPATAPTERRGPMLERVEQAMDDLGLSDEQKQQVREILDNAREQFQNMDPQQRRQRTRELLRDVQDQVMSLLDEDQKAAFQERLEQLRARFDRAGGRGGRDGPGTQPAGRPAALAEQIRNAIEQLQLTEEVKVKADKLLADLRSKLQTLRDEAAGDMEVFRTRAREMVNEARQDLEELLSDEQREKLRELIEAARRGVGRQDRTDRPNRPNRTDRDAAPAPAPPPESNPNDPQPGPGEGPRAALDPPVELQPGQVAPDFALAKLDGRPVQLSSFKGRVLVLLFGNYTSPSFRDRAEDYEQLRKQFANRAEFLIIYTRESHPVGTWDVERNKENRIAIEQHQSIDERKATAQQAKQALKLTIPIALDTMDDKTAQDYGGFTAAAVVIARDGTVAAHQKWADPHRLRSAIEQALASRASATGN